MQGAGAGQKWVIVTEREPALFRLALRASMRYDGPCGGRIVPRLTCAGGGSTQSLTEGVPSMEPKHYAAVVPLSDVGTIQVRAIRPDDRERILDLFHRLTRRTIYFRFHEPKTELSQDELTRYTDLDFEERVALVAVIGSGDAEKIVGVGRYVRVPDADPPCAQLAFAVEDVYQGRGIGSGLLKHLARIATTSGISFFEGRILPGNSHFLGLLEKSGFPVERLGQIEGLDRYVIRLS